MQTSLLSADPRRYRDCCGWGQCSSTPKSKHTCEVGLSESQATSEHDVQPNNCNMEKQIEDVNNSTHVSMNMKVAAGGHPERTLPKRGKGGEDPISVLEQAAQCGTSYACIVSSLLASLEFQFVTCSPSEYNVFISTTHKTIWQDNMANQTLSNRKIPCRLRGIFLFA